MGLADPLLEQRRSGVKQSYSSALSPREFVGALSDPLFLKSLPSSEDYESYQECDSQPASPMVANAGRRATAPDNFSQVAHPAADLRTENLKTEGPRTDDPRTEYSRIEHPKREIGTVREEDSPLAEDTFSDEESHGRPSRLAQSGRASGAGRKVSFTAAAARSLDKAEDELNAAKHGRESGAGSRGSVSVPLPETLNQLVTSNDSIAEGLSFEGLSADGVSVDGELINGILTEGSDQNNTPSVPQNSTTRNSSVTGGILGMAPPLIPPLIPYTTAPHPKDAPSVAAAAEVSVLGDTFGGLLADEQEAAGAPSSAARA
ncbi:hypothetical protein GNI_013620, partial [Gregarina niphandrodes]